MSGGRPFGKYQGLGNDFLLIDARETPLPLLPKGVRALCARRWGVGADGVLLLVAPGDAAAAAIAVVVYNADGSVAEVCGNGLRCVVQHLLRHGEIALEDEVVIETGCGLVLARACGEGIEIEMGAARSDASSVGFEGPAQEVGRDPSALLRISLEVHDRRLKGVAISLGNPHIVFFDLPRAHAADFGEAISTHPFFPRGVNAGFAHLAADGGIDLRVWERGAGLTLACGTGACAAVAAAVGSRRRPADRWIAVRLPGGELEVRVSDDLAKVWMRGPAMHVYDGLFSREILDLEASA